MFEIGLEEFYIIIDSSLDLVLCRIKIRLYVLSYFSILYTCFLDKISFRQDIDKDSGLRNSLQEEGKCGDPGTPCMRSIGTGHECEYRRPTAHHYHYHRRNYRDHGGCYKSHRRGRAVARQDIAVSLISLKERNPRRDTRRETLISYVATRKSIPPCLRAHSLFLSDHSHWRK